MLAAFEADLHVSQIECLEPATLIAGMLFYRATMHQTPLCTEEGQAGQGRAYKVEQGRAGQGALNFKKGWVKNGRTVYQPQPKLAKHKGYTAHRMRPTHLAWWHSWQCWEALRFHRVPQPCLYGACQDTNQLRSKFRGNSSQQSMLSSLLYWGMCCLSVRVIPSDL